MIVFAMMFLASCSGLKTYDQSPVKNLNINTRTDSTFFSSVDAMLHIYTVDHACQLSYAGTVKLTEPKMKVGIPENKTSYLEFEFASSAFLANRSSSISAETLIKTRSGYSYDFEVSYIDDLYNVELYEKSSNKAKRREIELIPLAACRKT